MKKNKLLKFISVFQIIVFLALFLVGAVCLAYALFQKFEVKAVLDLVNNKVSFIEELYLYVINFFETIYIALELGSIEFIAKLKTDGIINIVYTGIYVFLVLIAFIFACISSRTASAKTKGKKLTTTGLIINFVIAALVVTFAVYYFVYAKTIDAAVKPIAEAAFLKESFEYEPLINTIIIYSVAGVCLFISLIHLLALCFGDKEKRAKAPKGQKQSKVGYGSYNPKQKQNEEKLLPNSMQAEYMKYQDSKSSNPYINGEAKLTEEDLFGDLMPKKEPKVEEKPEPANMAAAPKPAPSPLRPTTPTTGYGATGGMQNNPFASSSYARPASPAPTPMQNPYAQQPNNMYNTYGASTPGYNNYGAQNPGFNTYGAPNQYNNFARPMPYNQPQQPVQPMNAQNAQQTMPQQAPTNINLTIQQAPQQPGAQPSTIQVVQTPQAAPAPAQPKPVKSANEAFAPKPKAPTQAVAKPKPQENLTDKLKELSTLRQSGAISDDEYKALKQKAFQKFLKS